QCEIIGFASQRILQQTMVAALWHLDRSEHTEMIGDILRVEQTKSSGLEPRDQVHQCDLGCVTGAVEHAFAEKSAPERDAVEPTNKYIAVIDLDRVAMTAIEKRAVDAANAAVDPCA